MIRTVLSAMVGERGALPHSDPGGEDEHIMKSSLQKAVGKHIPKGCIRQVNVGEEYGQETVGKETFKMLRSKDNAGESEAQITR